MVTRWAERYPPGSRVRVVQSFSAGAESVAARAEGTVEAWEESPTGSWYAHGKQHKLWLTRLRLRKADGELALLVIDDRTRVEPADVG
ncbi:MAG TPA: hypothetical protein PKK06_16175 [Phycisphaerae bacterium]|nr:hypothetical protein [Phycisphaerae bacterium]HNU46815.1 hypothetical protein [Phycisphaerae bacterium]